MKTKKREVSLLASLLSYEVNNIPLLPVSCVSALLALAVRYLAALYHSVERRIAYTKPVLYFLCAHHWVKHIRKYVLAERFYIMVYVLPMVIILASRFFWLCWKYRIPFFYFFAVNSIHLVYWSWYTTKEMIMAHFAIMAFTLLLYIYGAAEWFCSKSSLGKRLFN